MTAAALLPRLLTSLNCPFISQIVYVDNDTRVARDHVQTLVVWLEDRIIRELDVEERVPLRQPANQNEWDVSFNGYLKTLGCPFEWPLSNSKSDSVAESEATSLHWLLSFAVSLEYEENASNSYIIQAEDDSPEVIMTETEAETDVTLTQSVDRLASLVGLSRETEPAEPDVELLRRVHVKVKFYFSPSAIEACELFKQDLALGTAASVDPASENEESPRNFPRLSEFEMGFNCAGNETQVNEVLLVLKMLYLADYRDLQTDVNELIVLVQEYTANPRLNSALGKVGR